MFDLFKGCTREPGLTDSDVVGPDGCHWDDEFSYVMGALLRFCGCGRNEDAAAYIRDGLALIAERFATDEATFDYDTYKAKMDKQWPDSGARYFFWYWCDAEELTEHGGQVPGWLTPKGEAVLDFLKEQELDL